VTDPAADLFRIRVHSNAGDTGWLANPARDYRQEPSWQVVDDVAAAGVWRKAEAIELARSYNRTMKWRGPKARRWATMEAATEEQG
jgi:hypothetical protein